ncbi:hypothetical protein EYF80_004577 [Liparis tanakae]|uniref:Uncharacterized protein n=1 Tax=Liparis tanakae TaxID=230148 RepID=A0A4Z2J5D8_9TELE|nr:hypothetical protein EYF80_004577 [Liparis tanakae]
MQEKQVSHAVQEIKQHAALLQLLTEQVVLKRNERSVKLFSSEGRTPSTSITTSISTAAGAETSRMSVLCFLSELLLAKLCRPRSPDRPESVP